MIDCKIIAYNLKIRPKYSSSELSPSMIYLLLENISKMAYIRNPEGDQKSRFRRVGDFFLAMDIKSFPEELSDKGITEIPFIIGRESRESFPVRDEKGVYEKLNLPEDKNLCFKTHGKFLFSKVSDEWQCVLFLEKRFTCTGVGALISYIKKFDSNYSILRNTITKGSDFIELLKKLENVSAAIIKNHNLEFGKEDGAGTIKRKFSESGYRAKNIEIELNGSSSPFYKVTKFIRQYTGKKEITSKVMSDFVNDTELVLVYYNKGRRQLNLFDDLLFHNIKVKKDDSREIDSSNFFQKLNQILSQEEVNRVFSLAKKA